MKTDKRFYMLVDANTEEVDDFVPAAGSYYLSAMGGSAGPSEETSVKICWDHGEAGEEMLISTHNESNQVVNLTFTSDGVKKLSIVLTNDSQTPTAMGGFWCGED